MGGLFKLIVFSAVLLVSYALVSTMLSWVGLLVRLIGLNPSAEAYSVLFGEALAISCIVSVAVFFTVPAVLAMYGHAGAWVKHVVVRSAKGLSVAFGTSLLLYLGASAASAVQIGVDAASTAEAIGVLGLSGFLVVGLLWRETFLRGVEKFVDVSYSLPSVAHLSKGSKNI